VIYFNTATNTVTGTIPVGAAPAVIAIAPNGLAAYVCNNTSVTVSIINLATNTVAQTVSGFDFNPNPAIAITPNSQYAYVTNYDNDTVSVVSLGSLSSSYNTFIGALTGEAIGLGSSNTFVGYAAGQDQIADSNNIFIGYQAGLNNSGGSNNIFLGNLGPSSPTPSNLMLLGPTGVGMNTTLAGIVNLPEQVIYSIKGSTTVSVATASVVVYNEWTGTVLVNQGGITVSSGSTFKVPVAGVYLVTVENMTWSSNATNERSIWIALNGTTALTSGRGIDTNGGASSGTLLTTQGTSAIVSLAAGGTIEVVFEQNSGSTLTVGTNSLTYPPVITITKII
jgi:YVTN family beta-propeller protein